MEHERMRELRKRGYTLKQIACAADVSVKKVFTVVGRKGPPRPHKRRNAKRDKEIRELVSSGMRQVEVARLKGISKSRVSCIVKGE